MMWFLGAGCSVAAGIPAAGDIIWECKSRIYCSEHGIPRAQVSDIHDPKIQGIINEHLISRGVYPKTEADGDEYTYYFEKAMSSPADRHTYIKELVSKASPSYGHLILASLAKVSKAPIVWTTNFDRLYESAIYSIYKSANDLFVADLGEPDKANQAIDNRTIPLLVKIHGDFHSERLKNTKPELQSQDEKIRQALIRASTTYGMCVIGYSGRDKSVMDALKSAASVKGNFPHGIFWFTRPGNKPLESVTELIELARNNGIQAELIQINTFDEAMDGIRRYLGNFPLDIEELLKPKTSRKTDAPISKEAKNPPYLRLNALRIDSLPSMCKIVECEIGGYKEVVNAISDNKADVLAQRIKKGVIAFGSDTEIRKAFSKNKIKSINIHAIDHQKLTYASGEYKLVYDTLLKAISRKTGLSVEAWRDKKYLISSQNITPPEIFNQHVDGAVETVSGTVPGTGVTWRQACRIDIDYKFNKLWVLLSPRVLLSYPDACSEKERNIAKSFVKETTAPRKHPKTGSYTGYNLIAASILSGWISLLSEKTNTGTIVLPTFGLTDGLDPQFEISVNKVVSGRLK